MELPGIPHTPHTTSTMPRLRLLRLLMLSAPAPGASAACKRQHAKPRCNTASGLCSGLALSASGAPQEGSLCCWHQGTHLCTPAWRHLPWHQCLPRPLSNQTRDAQTLTAAPPHLTRTSNHAAPPASRPHHGANAKPCWPPHALSRSPSSSATAAVRAAMVSFSSAVAWRR